MTDAASRPLPFDAALPARMPADDPARLLLFALRRMAVAGIDDAHAQHAVLIGFGLGYRRPLVLLRALMLELSRAATHPIQVAPCCCPRMTAAEATLIDAAQLVLREPTAAHAALADVLGAESCVGALVTLTAVAEAFADAGRPLR